MTQMLPEDQAERDRAISPSLSVHVEAPAGSGKTTVLLKRYLKLLAQAREPEEILALTFTRKAAGELRARIQAELTKREGLSATHDLPPHTAELQDLALAALRRHADQGLALLERLQVSTFHGFCAQLLRLLPHQAGLPPDFNLLEESATTRLQQEAVVLMGRRLGSLPNSDPRRQALVHRLVRLNNNWPRLAAELQDLLVRRDILTDFITLARQSRNPDAYEGVLREHLAAIILPRLRRLSQEFRQAEIGRSWPDLHRCLADTGAGLADILPGDLPGEALEDLAVWRAIADSLLTAKGECYRKFNRPKFSRGFRESPWCRLLQDLPPGLVARLASFRDLSPVLLAPDEVDAVQDLIILLHQALTVYEELCAHRRSLDFTGLEQVALRVLTGDDLPELFRRLDRRLAHLLVDEFQDTSVNQMRLLCRLLAGWQGDRQRSLMVVGDPKQSIYGWRQARLELFFESREAGRLPDCAESPGFTPLTLKTNFRSSRVLIEWVNEVFGSTIMPSREESGVEFKAAAPGPGAEPGGPPRLALFTGPEARRREADWLTHELLQVCQRQPQAEPETRETVGVLLFTRRHLPAYLEAWRRAGLSPRVRDGLPLADSQAARQLHNLAVALVRPHDDLAWSGLLRSWAGPQPLGLLAEIAMLPGALWSEKIGSAAEAGGLPAVAALFQAVAAATKRVGREPLEATLAACLERLSGWEKIAAWEGPQGVANARAYLDLLAAAAAASPEATLDQAGDLLRRAYQPPDPRAQDSPVEVLTVHAAKGLEFDHVYLPFLDWQPRLTNDAPFLMEEVPGQGSAVIALNRPYTQTDQSVLYQTLRAAARQKALGEARRLFYVAVTRAKKRLHMSAVVGQDNRGGWKFTANSPLGWLREHYPEGGLHPQVVNLWQSPPLSVSLDPAALEPAPQAQEAIPVVAAYDFCPEPLPYEISFPSQLPAGPVGEGLMSDTADTLPSRARPPLSSPHLPRGISWSEGAIQAEGGDPVARRRGDIIHRLLQTISLGVVLPDPAALAPALHGLAATPAATLDLAAGILAEVRACQADPFLAPLLEPGLPTAKSEWLLEAWHTGNTLYRGQIDRLVFYGRQWWLLDYKTSRPAPETSWEEFFATEAAHYRPQLLAYREMAARFFELDPPELINTVLYFTACRRHLFL